MTHRIRQSGVQWGVFFQRRRKCITAIDIAPTTRRGHMSDRHVAGLGCQCGPSMDVTDGGIPIIIHGHRMTGGQHAAA